MALIAAISGRFGKERAPGGKPGFWRDRRGAAAVEFALIAPLLIGLYFMSMEGSNAIETKRKMSRSASMIGNIVAQQETVTKANLQDIISIGQSLLQPYNRSEAGVTVTGITMNKDDPPKPTVAWSYSVGGSALAKGGPAAVPTKLLSPGRFLVLVDSTLEYVPMIAWAAGDEEKAGIGATFSDITMGETHYEAPRYADISCTDC